MRAVMASQITSNSIVSSPVCSGSHEWNIEALHFIQTWPLMRYGLAIKQTCMWLQMRIKPNNIYHLSRMLPIHDEHRSCHGNTFGAAREIGTSIFRSYFVAPVESGWYADELRYECSLFPGIKSDFWCKFVSFDVYCCSIILCTCFVQQPSAILAWRFGSFQLNTGIYCTSRENRMAGS